MKIENQQVFHCGKGEKKLQLYFTIDLIPISVIFYYDVQVKRHCIPSVFSDELDCINIEIKPYYIDKIYTLEIYQQVIDLACDKLNLEKRNVFCSNRYVKKFNFSKDDSFYEYQFHGDFGRVYFIETKLHKALKYWEQVEKFRERAQSENLNYTEVDKQLYYQLYYVRDFIEKQGVFTNRDYHYITGSTMDNFIKNLGKKS